MTIVILIILATISIGTLFGENGLIRKAQEAKDHQSNAIAMEEIGMNKIVAEYANIMKEENKDEISEEQGIIDTNTSYVGYYADVDGEGTPDGVIYADLAISKSGQWGDANGVYAYDAITDTKDYIISETDYTGTFGTKPVISAVPESDGEERFYVMALTDMNSNDYYWYGNAYISDYSTVTSVDFGTGEANTATMIEKWNSKEYGSQSNDVWGAIQPEVAKGWFLPSRGEWAAFLDNLQITNKNYNSTFGLKFCYWSSSISSAQGAWSAAPETSNLLISTMNLYPGANVRLSITF